MVDMSSPIACLTESDRLDSTFIDGLWSTPLNPVWIPVINPATDVPVAEVARAPFGGYKRSGHGREYGIEGLEEYLETRAVLGLD